MVLSNIDSNINYFESNNIDKKDIDYESYVYKGRIYNKNIKFVLGNPNFEYIDNNIVYFNIYLVNKNSIVSKIGIYETENTIYRELLDEHGVIIIEKLNDPLMFLYSKTYIINDYELKEYDFTFDEDIIIKEGEGEGESESESESDSESGSDSKSEGDSKSGSDSEGENESDGESESEGKIESDLPEVDFKIKKENSDYEMANYKKQSYDTWINNFMKSHKYMIVDNEGGGDCFFAVLRDSLKSLDLDKYKSVSVKSIRNKLANEADEALFQTYKEIYDFYYDDLKKTQDNLSKLQKNHSVFKKLIGGTSNSVEQSDLLNKAKTNLSMIAGAVDKNKELDNLADEFKFMKDVKTLDDFKNVIRTTNFWADNWAISALERLYNVKFIILNQTNYTNGEIENVLLCGEADKKIQEKNIFEPDYYIIADYSSGVHYQLITHDKNTNKGAFKFAELPYRIIELILDKCMEHSAGPFALIPDFRNVAAVNNIELNKSEAQDEFETLVDKPQSNLYDKSLIIQIYKTAANKKVGEGTGEIIPPKLKTSANLLKLNKKTYENWRRKLDNSWLINDKDKEKGIELQIAAHAWPSVQHFMYASRFTQFPEIYKQFMTNSGHEAALTVENAKNLYDKMLKDKSYKSKITSEDIFKKEESKLLTQALMAKFSIEEFKEILLLTETALINIYKHKAPKEEATELMKVRQLLAK